MPLKTHKVKIADADDKFHEYQTTQYPGGESFELLMELLRIAGAAGGDVMDGVGDSFSMSELKAMATGQDVEGSGSSGFNGKRFGDAIINLVLEVQKSGGLAFMKRILQHTLRESGDQGSNALVNCSDSFDILYQGNIGEAIEAVAWVLKVNYGRTITRPFLKLLSSHGLTGILKI